MKVALKKYFQLFEAQVIVAGFEKEIIPGSVKLVPTRNSRLYRSPFGELLGNIFEHSQPFAIDYYGLTKKSTGFFDKCSEYKGVLVKGLEVPVIYFASIKPDIIEICAPELLDEFVEQKHKLIALRDFSKQAQTSL
jgi:hypothetical protein